MRTVAFFLILVLSQSLLQATTLHVGAGHPFANLSQAISAISPGDTILIHEGTYPGGLYFENIQGTPDEWISIYAAPGETVIFDGGNNAWQFTDAAYLHVRGIIFEHQLGNGVNFDDGGSYETPAHHVIFEECTFQDMNASGNNDLLKLSGIDSFEIRNCLFLNGAGGGSGVDLVGCHDALITGCRFENMGSNGIQAKGGTSNIRIEANVFKNCGHRAVNLGGSTGLQFFRPVDAEYEAADLKVYSNVFIGSTAPVAFVGCINTEVINNTIYLPDNWVLRILQETVDPSRFFPCGNNTFRNNLIVIDNNVNVVCNIGPNTAPETFTFSNNLWFHTDQPGWNGPVLPADDTDHLVGEDPLLEDPDGEDFSLAPGSPSIGAGFDSGEPTIDYSGMPFNTPRSIGAFEGNVISDVSEIGSGPEFIVFPNPARRVLTITIPEGIQVDRVDLISANGEILHSVNTPVSPEVTIPAEHLLPGVYVVCLHTAHRTLCKTTLLQ